MPGTRSSCAAALRAALFLLLALGSVPGASAQGSTLSASLADNACLTDDHCGDGAFCTPPVLDRPGAAGAVTGQCLPCWMCCSLQGSQLAAASSCAARRCTCDLGAPCATPSPVAPPADAPSPPTPTCTAGLECRDQTCQACRGCEWSPGGCSSSCTSLLSLVDYVERPGGIVRQIALLPDSPDVLFVQQWVAQYSGEKPKPPLALPCSLPAARSAYPGVFMCLEIPRRTCSSSQSRRHSHLADGVPYVASPTSLKSALGS